MATKPRKRRRPPEPFYALVRAKPGQDTRARLNCQRQGYTVLQVRALPASGHGKLVPFFPGYLFVLMDGMHFAPLRNTFGVLDWIGGPDGPWRVPYREIKRLRSLMDDEGIVRNAFELQELEAEREAARGTKGALSPGQDVEFTAGAFKSLPAVYKGLRPDQRINVIMNLMGKDVPMVVDRKEVRPAAKSGR